MKKMNTQDKSSRLDHNQKLLIALTDRASTVLDEAWSLWELDSSSKDLRDKFYILEQCLDHIKKVCEDRI